MKRKFKSFRKLKFCFSRINNSFYKKLWFVLSGATGSIKWENFDKSFYSQGKNNHKILLNDYIIFALPADS